MSNGTEVATREDVEKTATDLARKDDSIPADPAFEAAKRDAIALSHSSVVPENFRGNVANCLVALEFAKRLGASPLAVMQNLYIVKGKPSFSGSFLIGAVNQAKEFTPLRYRFEGEPGTLGYGCRAVARDAETGEELVGTLVTLGMAKEESWGAKWRTMPEQMLRYRSAAFWARAYAPHITMGMHFVDELEDVSARGGSRFGDEQKVSTDTLNDALDGDVAEAKVEVLVDESEASPEEPKEVAVDVTGDPAWQGDASPVEETADRFDPKRIRTIESVDELRELLAAEPPKGALATIRARLTRLEIEAGESEGSPEEGLGL